MSNSYFGKLFFLFIISLFLNNVFCQDEKKIQTKAKAPSITETEQASPFSNSNPNSNPNSNRITYYETNFLISNINNLNSTAKTCSTLDDCPIYASSCSPSCINDFNNGKHDIKCTPYNVCNFEFKCRANYPCLIKFNNTLEYETVKTRYEQQQQNINKTSEIAFFNKEFMLGNQVDVDMNSCYMDTNNNKRTYECSSKSCQSDDDCYSRNCDKEKGRCRRNDKIKEYYCKPFNGSISCKLDNQQPCKTNNECASGVCDYIGICLTNYNEDNVKIYNDEVIKFYVLIGFFFTTIVAVLLCSCYCSRGIKGGSRRKNHRLED